MNRAIFIDRDGVLNELVTRDDGRVTSPWKLEELKYMPLVQESVKIMRDYGYLIFIVTNQPGLYYGDMELEDLIQINNAIKYWIRADDVYAALFPMKNGVMKNAPEQDYKPAPGGIKKLIKKYNVDPHQSYMIGDRWKDIVAGHDAELLTIYCNVCKYYVEEGALDRWKAVKPDFWVKNISEAAKLLKKIHAVNIRKERE